jgi:hypothetical protein
MRRRSSGLMKHYPMPNSAIMMRMMMRMMLMMMMRMMVMRMVTMGYR